MFNNKDKAPQYFRQEANYAGDEKPIILVDGPDGDMDSVIDISGKGSASPSNYATANDARRDNDAAREIISLPVNDPSQGEEVIGDEWLNSSEIVASNVRAASRAAINQFRQAVRDKAMNGSGASAVNMGRGHVTIEEVVRESVRPYLKTWVDHNLESIVKEVMRRELARLG